MADLDEKLLNHILGFVSDPLARSCCREWLAFLSASLQLAYPIRFKRSLHLHGQVSYDHYAARASGTDFEEQAEYHFIFFSKFFRLTWLRTSPFWAREECFEGRWEIRKDVLHCVTNKSSQESSSTSEIAPRSRASAARAFNLQLDDVFKSRTSLDDALLPWEYALRGQLAPAKASSVVSGLQCQETYLQPRATQDANYVEIHGELHLVSEDIRTSYPEADWHRLMNTRIRFGLGAARE